MKRTLNLFIAVAFIVNTLLPYNLFAQTHFGLPPAGMMVNASVTYNPMMLTGMRWDKDNPLRFTFLFNNGDSRVDEHSVRMEAQKLIEYFMAALTTPEDDLWVNLSPYEQSRVITQSFAQTQMGKDLLCQDYILKQLSSSLMAPDSDAGKAFWQDVYKKAQHNLGMTNVPVNTYHKIWISPKTAVVKEEGNSVVILDSSLNVQLEEDYLASNIAKSADSSVSSDAFKKTVLPIVEKEVNSGKNFAQLRQIYNSITLAIWYKTRLKEAVFSKAYADKNKIPGIDINDKTVKEKIYAQYIEAFQKGTVNCKKSEVIGNKKTTRAYFSGGFNVKGIQRGFALKETIVGLGTAVILGLGAIGILQSCAQKGQDPAPAASATHSVVVDMQPVASAVPSAAALPENISVPKTASDSSSSEQSDYILKGTPYKTLYKVWLGYLSGVGNDTNGAEYAKLLKAGADIIDPILQSDLMNTKNIIYFKLLGLVTDTARLQDVTKRLQAIVLADDERNGDNWYDPRIRVAALNSLRVLQQRFPRQNVVMPQIKNKTLGMTQITSNINKLVNGNDDQNSAYMTRQLIENRAIATPILSNMLNTYLSDKEKFGNIARILERLVDADRAYWLLGRVDKAGVYNENFDPWGPHGALLAEMYYSPYTLFERFPGLKDKYSFRHKDYDFSTPSAKQIIAYMTEPYDSAKDVGLPDIFNSDGPAIRSRWATSLIIKYWEKVDPARIIPILSRLVNLVDVHDRDQLVEVHRFLYSQLTSPFQDLISAENEGYYDDWPRGDDKHTKVDPVIVLRELKKLQEKYPAPTNADYTRLINLAIELLLRVPPDYASFRSSIAASTSGAAIRGMEAKYGSAITPLLMRAIRDERLDTDIRKACIFAIGHIASVEQAPQVSALLREIIAQGTNRTTSVRVFNGYYWWHAIAAESSLRSINSKVRESKKKADAPKNIFPISGTGGSFNYLDIFNSDEEKSNAVIAGLKRLLADGKYRQVVEIVVAITTDKRWEDFAGNNRQALMEIAMAAQKNIDSQPADDKLGYGGMALNKNRITRIGSSELELPVNTIGFNGDAVGFKAVIIDVQTMGN